MINAEKTNTYGTIENSTTEITLGTAYDINKDLVERYEKELTAEKIIEKKEMLLNYLESHSDTYYMLLCNDRKDYTLFNLVDSKTELINVLVDECLKNRGIIKGIDQTQDQYAIEIWLSIDGESFCYYFFPYGEAVIKV